MGSYLHILRRTDIIFVMLHSIVMDFSNHIMKGLRGEFNASISKCCCGFYMQKAILSKIYAIYVEHRINA